MNEFVYYYKIKKDGTISILNVLGNYPCITIPSVIDARFVTEIDSYCFSKKTKLIDYQKTDGDISLLDVLIGEKVESVTLSDTITKINSYAFYNCRKCKEIQITENVVEVGSDVFLNCVSLHKLRINCSHDKTTALKLFLKQITWDIDVYFKDMTLMFPEYYENYDVIGPAHIFGMNIIGEGYRARQCFKNNQFLIHEYDRIFEKLCIEESVKTLCHFAWNRIFMPLELSGQHKDSYFSYVKEHPLELALPIVINKEINNEEKKAQLLTIINNDLMDLETINNLIEKVSDLENVELLTYLIQWKKEFFMVKNTYEFEDF